MQWWVSICNNLQKFAIIRNLPWAQKKEEKNQRNCRRCGSWAQPSPHWKSGSRRWRCVQMGKFLFPPLYILNYVDTFFSLLFLLFFQTHHPSYKWANSPFFFFIPMDNFSQIRFSIGKLSTISLFFVPIVVYSELPLHPHYQHNHQNGRHQNCKQASPSPSENNVK